MPSWGNRDAAANAPYWAVNSTVFNATNVETNYASPTAANVARLYANTTANVYTTQQTVGLFGIDATEVANTQQKAVSHAGWVMKTTGQSGRAGRVTYETLVALSTMTLDGDGTTIANTANP
jgi:endonuclease YncB( thermonuclease family)